MANHQNSQPPYSQQDHPTPPNHQRPTNFGAQSAYPQQTLHRTSSFDAGDDSRFFEPSQQQSRASISYSGYGPTTNTIPAAGRTSQSNVQSALPYRSSSSQNIPLGGYQHQYQPGTSSHAAYNPAQYQQQSQYNPQAYNTPQAAFGAGSYQPYVPAAYNDSNLNRQSSSYSSANYFDSHSHPTTLPTQAAPPPPPPPPRNSEILIGQQSSSYGAYHHEPSYQYSSQLARQPLHSPPAPAPPPHDALYSGGRLSHSNHPSQDHSGLTTSVPSTNPNPNRNTYSSPDIDRNSSFASRISTQSSSYNSSPQQSVRTPPSRQLSNRSPQRSNTSDRHPQGRSLPGVPSESESDNDYFSPFRDQGSTPQNQSPSSYDELMHHLDAAIDSQSGRLETDPSTQVDHTQLTPDEPPTHLNGNIASTGNTYINYGAFADDSDAEAAAGVAAMLALDEQEKAEDARRRSGSATLFPSQSRQSEPPYGTNSSQGQSSDSDYTGYDLSAAGGGYAGNVHYGTEPVSNYAAAAAMPYSDYYERLNPRMSSVRSSAMSSEGRESQASEFESLPPTEALHPFPEVRDVARVDTGGTGGLTEPSPHARRLSYEDGDEAALLDSETMPTPEGSSPSKESLPELFFHPGMSQQRPLPPPPSNSDPGVRPQPPLPAGTYTQQNRFSQYTDTSNRPPPLAPDAYMADLLNSSAVPRSTSLISNRSTPKVDYVIRSKTDADRVRILRQQQLPERALSDIYDNAAPETSVPLDLPALPRKKFNPAKMANDQFKKCSEPWALSSILSWIRDLAEEETDLRENTIVEGIVALFMNKVPTMHTTDAEALGERVVKDMLASNAVIKEEEWVKFGPGTMSGVLFQLTGTGCYSSKLHLHPNRGRCYSYHCMRTLKVVDLDSLPTEKKSEDWATYYKLTKQDWESHDKKEVERQNVLHEIVTSEDLYISQLDVLRVLYRDQLAAAQPPIINAKKLPTFIKEVFGHADKVKKVNQDFLLGHLKYRQGEQGPWIVGFSDIFREWIRRARSVYVEYATNYPRADFLVRREAERNLLFKTFLDQAREDRRSSRLSWDSYLKGPITRLQRYGLLLQTVQKNMVKDSEEKANLLYAIDEIRSTTFECNAKLAEMEKKMTLIEYGSKLRLRPPMEKEVELNLDHLGREIIIKGDLLRAGGKGFQWVDTHAILFDHYLVLAKTLSRDRKQEYYDVSKVPIPMDLIILESSSDPAVVKSSVKGIGAVTTTVVPRGQTNLTDARLARTTSTTSGIAVVSYPNSNLSNTSSNTSQQLVPTTSLEAANSKDEKIMYPFRVKHLGKSEVYTLYAPTAQNRQDWCEAIITAKTKHAEQLFAQHSEPFKLRVLADTAFAYEGLSYPSKRILIRGTPLDRAIQEAEKKFVGQGRPPPVCRAQVNCATVFNQPYGRLMCAVGTDYGVYLSEYQNSRGWVRAIQMPRVSQITVLEEFNLFLLISDKALIAYHLDVVCPPTGNAMPQSDASARRAPQKLSGSKDVGFFVTGKMKDRALVFYKKRDGMTSIFKVLEPVLQKSTTTRSRFLPSSTRRGQTEFFREFDEFYIPAECYGLNLFSSSLAISTARGVEVLTLDKKQTWSVPNLRSDQADTQAHLSSIASRIKDLKPLGMFRLGEAEFLVTFDECAVYVNKHGDISRGVVMEFVGKANSACLHGQYLILFDDDFVEIRDSQNGRLKQVIAGRDIRMLDDGGGGAGGAPSQAVAGLGGGANGLGLQGFGAAPRTVKVCMQHPEFEKSHVIVELIQTLDNE